MKLYYLPVNDIKKQMYRLSQKCASESSTIVWFPTWKATERQTAEIFIEKVSTSQTTRIVQPLPPPWLPGHIVGARLEKLIIKIQRNEDIHSHSSPVLTVSSPTTLLPLHPIDTKR